MSEITFSPQKEALYMEYCFFFAHAFSRARDPCALTCAPKKYSTFQQAYQRQRKTVK